MSSAISFVTSVPLSASRCAYFNNIQAPSTCVRPQPSRARRRRRCTLSLESNHAVDLTTSSSLSSYSHGLSESSVFFATCVRGLGPTLAEELSSHPEIQATILNVVSSGVYFQTSSVAAIYSCALWVRCAVRILHQLGTFQVNATEQLYESIVSQLDWCYLLKNGHLTFQIQVRSSSSNAQQLDDEDDSNGGIMNVGLTVKNAICDALRNKGFEKPNVPLNYSSADVPLFVAVDSLHGQVSVYRDMTGTSLHKRGYKSNSSLHRSNLNESLAAGLLYLSGFKSDGSYVKAKQEGNDSEPTKELLIIDPMCGSATLLIEAMLLLLQVPLGLYRPFSFAFEQWPDFNDAAFKQACQRARQRHDTHKPLDASCIGIDMNRAAVAIAETSIDTTNLHDYIRIYHSDIARFPSDVIDRERKGKGGRQGGTDKHVIVVSNPPWGRRLENELDAWYQMGQFLRRNAGRTGMLAVLLSGDASVTRPLKMKASQKVPVRIGNVDARILTYTVLPKRDDSVMNARAQSSPSTSF